MNSLREWYDSVPNGKKAAAMMSLADYCRVSVAAVKMWVYGLRYPRPETAQRVVAYFDGQLSMADIYRGANTRDEAA